VSGKKAKAVRKAARVQTAQKRQQPRSLWGSWKGWAIALGVLAIIAASFVVPKSSAMTARAPRLRPAMSA
jgi:anti-sigma-K factor RskA